jgi:hypothetical protein
LSGTIGENDWYIGDVTVTLTASDAGPSGVDYTKYRIDSGSWKTYTAPFTVTTDGVHRVDYYSVDKAGNRESTKFVSFKIDKTAPTTSYSLDPAEPDGENGWYVSNVKITLTATDATSGVNYTEYNLDGTGWIHGTSFTVREDGKHTLDYRSVDMAGNTESTKHDSFKVDQTSPTVNITKPEEGYLYIFGRQIMPIPSILQSILGKTLIIGTIEVEVTASDETSGMWRVEFWINGVHDVIGDDYHEPYIYHFHETGILKTYTLETIAYDNAGNTDSDTIEFKVINLL